MGRYTTKIDGRYALFRGICIRKDMESGFSEIGEAVNKLGELEDLEENNLLIKLPCKVGDVVYVPMNHYYIGMKLVEKKKVFQTTIKKIEISDRGIKFITKMNFGVGGFTPSDFGKTVFLTQDKAEQALAKM